MAVNLICFLAPFYHKTLKVKEIDRDIRESLLDEYGRLIYAFWHNRFFPLILENRDSGIVVLVSLSKDGDLIDAILRKFGFETVRGSTSRGAISALKALVRKINQGKSVAIMPDGPKGPVYEVKEGVISLSKLTGIPILPVTVVYSSFWELSSWDRFRIPKPFSRVLIKYGDPLFISRSMDNRKAALLLKDKLFSLEEEALNKLKGEYRF